VVRKTGGADLWARNRKFVQIQFLTKSAILGALYAHPFRSFELLSGIRAISDTCCLSPTVIERSSIGFKNQLEKLRNNQMDF